MNFNEEFNKKFMSTISRFRNLELLIGWIMWRYLIRSQLNSSSTLPNDTARVICGDERLRKEVVFILELVLDLPVPFLVLIYISKSSLINCVPQYQYDYRSNYLRSLIVQTIALNTMQVLKTNHQSFNRKTTNSCLSQDECSTFARLFA